METIERRYVDKTVWPHGPWMDEPDKVQFSDKVTGLPCLVVRGPMGALCGYVGISEGHRFFGVDYGNCPTQCDENYCEHSPGSLLEVHGGITFADFCQEGKEETGICHVPAPGEPDRVWWLGFDCAHSGDLMPKYDTSYTRYDEVYRDLDYVKDQCARLSAQLVAV